MTGMGNYSKALHFIVGKIILRRYHLLLLYICVGTIVPEDSVEANSHERLYLGYKALASKAVGRILDRRDEWLF